MMVAISPVAGKKDDAFYSEISDSDPRGNSFWLFMETNEAVT